MIEEKQITYQAPGTNGAMKEKGHKEKQGNYLKFLAMIGTSMLVMYFLMYLNSYQIIDHFWFSETRLFMDMIMGAAMIVIMLAFMLGMYKNRTANIALFSRGGAAVRAGAVAGAQPGHCHRRGLHGRA